MGTCKIKRVIVALLAVTMLVVSSAFVASAKVSSRTYGVSSGSFKATLTSETNGVSRTVVSNSLTTSNHTTGVSLTKSSNMSGYYGRGFLNSLSYQGMSVSLASVPQTLVYHYFTSAVNATVTWFNYSTGVPY